LSWTQVLQIDNATPPPATTQTGANAANTLTAFFNTSLVKNGDNSMLRPLESIITSQFICDFCCTSNVCRMRYTTLAELE